jgi:PAS domain S-box-containing protein
MPAMAELRPDAASRNAFTFTGEFRDPREEQAFRASIREETRDLARLVVLIATGIFFLAALRDYWAFGFAEPFGQLFALRLLGLAVGGLFFWLVARASSTDLLFRLIGFGELALNLHIIASWFLAHQRGIIMPTITPPAITMAAVFGYYLVVPNSMLVAVLNAGLLSAGFLALSATLFGNAPAEVYLMAVLLLGVNITGFVGMRRIKLARRRNYLSAREAERSHAERDAALAQSRQREAYQAWALDALPIGVALFDSEMRLHTVNQRAVELLDVPADIVKLGTTLDEVMRVLARRRDFGEYGMEDFRHYLNLLVSGETSTQVARHRRTGKVLDFTIGNLPDGSLAFAIADASERDATDRRLRHAVEVAGDGFAIYDSEDRVVICSSRFAALYGLTVEEAVGKRFDELIAIGYERGVFDPAESRAEDGAVSHRTLDRRAQAERTADIRTRGGEWYLVQERVTPSGDLVVVRSNITARRRIEDELRRAKDDAERALADLKEAQSSLILAEKMASLGSMVAGMSHEISTPLGIGVSAASHLAGELEELARQVKQGVLEPGKLDDFIDTAVEATRIMQGNLSRAARLMQAFKQVSADQTNDSQRAFDIGAYLREVLLSLAPALRRTPHRVELDCTEGLMVEHRPGALSQIITNLVLNALQHAYEGRSQPGLIRIRVAPVRADRVAIDITDDGKGIPPTILPRIFDPFFTTRRGTGGTGLGMHIVYNLVTQVLGGAITVQSRPNGGTRFTIILPLEAPAKAA